MNVKKIISIIAGVSIVLVILGFFVTKKPVPPQKTIDFATIRKQFIENSREIRGKVEEVAIQNGGEKMLTVQVQIPDVSSEKISFGELPRIITKTIQILIDSNSSINGSSNFEVGDTVSVLLNTSVYNSDEFTAVKASIYDIKREKMEQITHTELINGRITKVGKDFVVLNAETPDMTKLDTLDLTGSFSVPLIQKDYKVFVDNKTQFPDGRSEALKVGNIVSAWGTGDLFKLDSFTATKIFIEQ